MNRCFRASWLPAAAAPLILLLSLLAGATPALAQDPAASFVPQRVTPISAKSQRGTLRVTTPPDVLLNGKPARLAPGARIRDRNNLITVSGAFIGQDLPVRYTLDGLGLVFEVWVLTTAEVARDPLPK